MAKSDEWKKAALEQPSASLISQIPIRLKQCAQLLIHKSENPLGPDGMHTFRSTNHVEG